MDRRLLIAVLVALAAQVPLTMVAAPAYADDDEGDGGSDDGSSDDDSSDDDGSDGDGSDDDGSDDDGGDDDGGDDDGGDDHPGTGDDDDSGEAREDHDDALQAVETGDALTLKQILAIFAKQASGTVIDVTLQRRRQALVYRVKYIDPAGRVKRIEFDAVSGSKLR